MKRTANILMILAIAVAVVGVCDDSAMAQATTRYFCDSDGDWSVGANWNTEDDCSSGVTGEPQDGDDAIILANNICTVDEDTAPLNLLDVNSGADLRIAASQSVILVGSAQTSTIAGTITFLNSGSTISVTASHTIDGGGSITGAIVTNPITIASGATLTNGTTIYGPLTIDGDGTFNNDGTVEAVVFGDVRIEPESITDTGNALWKVSGSNARLLIDIGDSTASSLAGDFTVTAGTLEVEHPGFTTSGVLTFTGGTIDTISSQSFDFSVTFTGS